MSRFFRAAGDSDSESSSSEEEELMSSDDEGPKQTAPSTKPAMSRFLKRPGDSDSSDESSDEEESEMSSSEEEQEVKPKAGRFLRGASSEEDSDEDVKRVVKSARDKRLDEMEATGKAMDNALKINDWVAIQNGKLVAPQTISSPVYMQGLTGLRATRRVRQARAHGTADAKRLRAGASILYPHDR